MGMHGPLSHIDLTIRDPDRSIPFYDAFFLALGYRRLRFAMPDFEGERPRRACWGIRYPGGGSFAVEVRPASDEGRDKRHDRYSPGVHHFAFHASSPEQVDGVHEAVRHAGGEVLDAPADYSGNPAYSEGYYAVFFADPDGVKLEVVYEPRSNP